MDRLSRELIPGASAQEISFDERCLALTYTRSLPVEASVMERFVTERDSLPISFFFSSDDEHEDPQVYTDGSKVPDYPNPTVSMSNSLRPTQKVSSKAFIYPWDKEKGKGAQWNGEEECNFVVSDERKQSFGKEVIKTWLETVNIEIVESARQARVEKRRSRKNEHKLNSLTDQAEHPNSNTKKKIRCTDEAFVSDFRIGYLTACWKRVLYFVLKQAPVDRALRHKQVPTPLYFEMNEEQEEPERIAPYYSQKRQFTEAFPSSPVDKVLSQKSYRVMPIDSSLVTPPITRTENDTHQECQDVPTLNIPPSGAFSHLQRLQCVLNFLKKELVVNDYSGTTVEEQIKDLLAKRKEGTQKILHWITREGETSNKRYHPGSDLQQVYEIGSIEELERKLRNDMSRFEENNDKYRKDFRYSRLDLVRSFLSEADIKKAKSRISAAKSKVKLKERSTIVRHAVEWLGDLILKDRS